jgi:peptidyl-prolyl cis-trans isomerase C
MSSTSSAHDARPETLLPRRDGPATHTNVFARAMREPLVHFLLAGFALFVLYGLLQPERLAPDTSRRIELSASDVARVELAFVARWQRPPTAAELQGLLASEVRNEILSREAIALGLDKDDVIVKRRLAQKMEFLADDVSGLREPTSEELRAWFDANKSEFAQPSRITFRHVFFSTDRRGADAEPAARKALASVTGRRDTAPRGDAFMFQDHYADRTEAQLAQMFGSDFATTVFSSPLKRWSGPLESGLGWHIVWTEELRTGEVPSYEDVEREVRERWTLEQREAAKRAGFEAMLARYEIVMPESRAGTGTSAPRAAPTR